MRTETDDLALALNADTGNVLNMEYAAYPVQQALLTQDQLVSLITWTNTFLEQFAELGVKEPVAGVHYAVSALLRTRLQAVINQFRAAFAAKQPLSPMLAQMALFQMVLEVTQDTTLSVQDRDKISGVLATQVAASLTRWTDNLARATTAMSLNNRQLFPTSFIALHNVAGSINELLSALEEGIEINSKTVSSLLTVPLHNIQTMLKDTYLLNIGYAFGLYTLTLFPATSAFAQYDGTIATLLDRLTTLQNTIPQDITRIESTTIQLQAAVNQKLAAGQGMAATLGNLTAAIELGRGVEDVSAPRLGLALSAISPFLLQIIQSMTALTEPGLMEFGFVGPVGAWQTLAQGTVDLYAFIQANTLRSEFSDVYNRRLFYLFRGLIAMGQTLVGALPQLQVAVNGEAKALSAAVSDISMDATAGFTGLDQEITAAITNLALKLNAGAPLALTDLAAIGVLINDDSIQTLNRLIDRLKTNGLRIDLTLPSTAITTMVSAGVEQLLGDDSYQQLLQTIKNRGAGLTPQTAQETFDQLIQWSTIAATQPVFHGGALEPYTAEDLQSVPENAVLNYVNVLLGVLRDVYGVTEPFNLGTLPNGLEKPFYTADPDCFIDTLNYPFVNPVVWNNLAQLLLTYVTQTAVYTPSVSDRCQLQRVVAAGETFLEMIQGLRTDDSLFAGFVAAYQQAFDGLAREIYYNLNNYSVRYLSITLQPLLTNSTGAQVLALVSRWINDPSNANQQDWITFLLDDLNSGASLQNAVDQLSAAHHQLSVYLTLAFNKGFTYDARLQRYMTVLWTGETFIQTLNAEGASFINSMTDMLSVVDHTQRYLTQAITQGQSFAGNLTLDPGYWSLSNTLQQLYTLRDYVYPGATAQVSRSNPNGWALNLGTAFYDIQINDMAVAPDGGVVLLGTKTVSTEFTLGQIMVIIKLDAMQKVEWAQQLSNPDFPIDTSQVVGTSIAVMPDSSIVVAGYQATQDLGVQNTLLIHLDAMGSLQWAKKFDNQISFNHIARTSNNRFVAVGIAPTDEMTDGIFFAEWDVLGLLLKRNTFKFSRNVAGWSVAMNPLGGAVVVGTQVTGDAALGDQMVVIRLDPFYQSIWVRTLSAHGVYLSGNSVAVSAQGDVYVLGNQVVAGATTSQTVLAHFDSRLQLQWVRVLKGWAVTTIDPALQASTFFQNGVGSHSIQALREGGCVFTVLVSNAQGGSDILLARVDAGGEPVWGQLLGTGNGILPSLDLTDDEQIVVAGTAFNFCNGTTTQNIVAEFDALGNITDTSGRTAPFVKLAATELVLDAAPAIYAATSHIGVEPRIDSSVPVRMIATSINETLFAEAAVCFPSVTPTPSKTPHASITSTKSPSIKSKSPSIAVSHSPSASPSHRHYYWRWLSQSTENAASSTSENNQFYAGVANGVALTLASASVIYLLNKFRRPHQARHGVEPPVLPVVVAVTTILTMSQLGEAHPHHHFADSAMDWRSWTTLPIADLPTTPEIKVDTPPTLPEVRSIGGVTQASCAYQWRLPLRSVLPATTHQSNGSPLIWGSAPMRMCSPGEHVIEFNPFGDSTLRFAQTAPDDTDVTFTMGKQDTEFAGKLTSGFFSGLGLGIADGFAYHRLRSRAVPEADAQFITHMVHCVLLNAIYGPVAVLTHVAMLLLAHPRLGLSASTVRNISFMFSMAMSTYQAEALSVRWAMQVAVQMLSGLVGDGAGKYVGKRMAGLLSDEPRRVVRNRRNFFEEQSASSKKSVWSQAAARSRERAEASGAVIEGAPRLAGI